MTSSAARRFFDFSHLACILSIGFGKAAFALSIALALGASLFRGGNRHVALIGLEWMALLTLLAFSASVLASGRLPFRLDLRGGYRWGLILLAVSPVWVSVIQSLLLHGTTDSPAFPLVSWHAAFVGLTMTAFFLMGVGSPLAHVKVLLGVWVWTGVAQAALGLVQLGDPDVFRFGFFGHERVIGSFASKNTYSNFLVMSIPVVIYKLLERADAARRDPSARALSWAYVLALFTLLAAIIASTSRTGIATSLLVVVFTALLLSLILRRGSPGDGPSRDHRIWLLIGVALLLLLVLLSGGLDWVGRFDSDRLVTDNATRALMRLGSWQGAMAYWPWGSGLGTYAGVFPRFQAPELGRWLIDLAHNDYLQALMEMGVAFVLIAGVALALITQRLLRMARAALAGRRQRHSRRSSGRMGNGVRLRWHQADTLALASGLGALAPALHAWVDYPFRIPANGMFAAFLLGVFLREPTARSVSGQPRDEGDVQA